MVVEEAHVEARTAIDDVDDESITALTVRINSFLLRNAIYIGDRDRDLVDRYLQAVFGLIQEVKRHGGPEDRQMLADTRPLPRDFGFRVKSLSEALSTMESLREELRTRVRSELGGPNLADEPGTALSNPPL